MLDCLQPWQTERKTTLAKSCQGRVFPEDASTWCAWGRITGLRLAAPSARSI